jgi:hypothetical protein
MSAEARRRLQLRRDFVPHEHEDHQRLSALPPTMNDCRLAAAAWAYG